MSAPADLMTIPEVADLLRLGERKVYEMASNGDLPCLRVTGKWLFPRSQLELWLAKNIQLPSGMTGCTARPPILVGSQDHLLEWVVRQADCGIALLLEGSTRGLRRFAAQEAMLCGLHVIDEGSEDFNIATVRHALPGVPYVQIHWARREVGLVLASGNPKRIRAVADLARDDVRVVDRTAAAGSHLLFRRVLRDAGLGVKDLSLIPIEARNETDIAAMILEGRADAGFAVRAAANRFGLSFLPLRWDCFDLVIERRDYFEPPFQKLLKFAATPALAERARLFGGYDVSDLGRVRANSECP